MALTYAESSALMTDIQFRGRVKVSCLNFAKYISGEPPDVPAHSSRVRWAQNCYLNPDAVANQMTPGVVMEPQVQESGSAISDADLQTATEEAVNKVL